MCGAVRYEASGDLGPIIELHRSSFDEPEGLVPAAHAFYRERLPWFDIADDLPRYDGFAEIGALLGRGPQSSERVPGCRGQGRDAGSGEFLLESQPCRSCFHCSWSGSAACSAASAVTG